LTGWGWLVIVWAMRNAIVAVAALMLAGSALAAGKSPEERALAGSPEERAAAVLRAVPLVDGHNDWPGALRTAYGVEGSRTADLRADPTGRTPQAGHTSIPLLRQGQLGGQIWSAYVSMALPPEEAVKQTFEQIALIHSMVDRHPETFRFVTTADGIERAFKAGKIASLIGLEGAHQVNDDPALLRKAYVEGVRSMTLTHSRNNSLVDSATADPKLGGMSAAGQAMVKEMNRLGVLVDISHVSPAVMHAVLDATASPVIFSHSSAKAVTNHPRNAPDDVLQRLKANGGLLMVTFVPSFVDQARADWQVRRDAQRMVAGSGAAGDAAMAAWDAANPRPVSTLAMVADHIDHAARVAGHDHVGIGGDYDGIPDLPRGLETVATYPALFAELARRGWSDADLKKLAGLNFLRVLRANEAVAKRLQKSG
jgi:membrane dipeptidase